jgi:YesN/AraC family two-component response regulator
MHKILRIDDEPDVLDTLDSLIDIKLSSCETTKAANGLDAFIATQNTQFDLIITDHKMPFMTGAALIIGIRTKITKNKNTPIIMLSGNIDDSLKSNLKIQNVHFVEKPFTPDDFLDVIRTYLI